MPVSTVCRMLAFAAAAVVFQYSLAPAAQAAAIQAADLSSIAADRHVGYYPIDARRLEPAPPLMVSLGSAVSYDRTAASGNIESPRAAGALGAYFSGRSGQNASRWQFDETPRSWHFRSGHWHDFDDGHHGRNEVGVGNQPPAVPIPATVWLFASGAALLMRMNSTGRGRAARQKATQMDEGMAR